MVEKKPNDMQGPNAPASIRVLHVEDNPADAGLVGAVLEDYTDARFNCENLPTLEAARARVCDTAKERIDVVLLDLGLPDSQGMESLHGMLEVSAGIPVVVLTGIQDARLGREAVGSGAEDYLEKNLAVQGTLLARTLEYAIERLRRRREQAANAPETPAADAGPPRTTVIMPPAEKEALHMREPDGFDALQKSYLSLLRNNADPARQQALGIAASDIIDQLIALQADPLDLVFLHSRAMRLIRKNGDDKEADEVKRGRQLFLTMMSRLTNYYLVEGK